VRLLHPDAQAQIEQMQPFQVPPSLGHPSQHPLARLYHLEQRDKHRTLNLTTFAARGRLWGLPPHIHTPPGSSGLRRGAYERGAVLASLTGVPVDPRASVVFEVTHEVVFADGATGGEEVLTTLDGIAQRVRLVVSQFERFFPPRV
jgi:hypothetical protein